MIPKYQEGQTSRDLVAVSSVCSYWRNTFLTTPSIWTRLDGKGMKKTRAWLERSKALPIQLEVGGYLNRRVMKFLAPYFSRLDVMDLPCLNAWDLSLVHNHLTNIRFLRDLRIQVSNPRASNTPLVMDGEFPSLERLHISGVQLSITNLRTPNLRNLLLWGAVDIRTLLDLLETSPVLELLVLKFDHHQDASISTGRKVVLGNIKVAHFLRYGPKVLQHLSLPSGGDVKIVEEISPGQLDGTTNSYTQLLSQAFNNLPMAHQAESLTFHTTGVSRNFLLEGPNGTLELANKDNDPTTCITLLRSLAQYSAPSIQDLRIPPLDVPPRDPGGFNDFLRSLSGLRTIFVHHSLVSQCSLALGTDYCPLLYRLCVHRPLRWVQDHHELARFAKIRSEAGVPIQRLLVNNYSAPFDVAVVGMLREYVWDVVWI